MNLLDPERTGGSARPDAVGLASGAPVRTGSRTRVVLVALVGLGVLVRVVWILRNGSSFDESFTALMGRRSFGDLLASLRATDSHPPLDYLLRAPLARAGAGDLALRFPSFVFSVAALALFAWWMRARDVAGIVAVGLMALSPFQIMYGGEARMYALLELLGVASAVLADAWLRAPRKWHAPLVSAIVLVATLDHVSGFLLAVGLFLVAGWRGDRAAWRWRGGIAAALAAWTLLWGASFSQQASTTHASWIGRTTVSSVLDAVTSLVTTQHGVALLVVAAVTAGLWVVVRGADVLLRRVVLSCGVVPVVLAALIGLAAPFFIDRTLTVSAWAPCLAVGMLVQWAGRRTRVAGIAAVLLIAALVLPASAVFLGRHWEYDAAAARVGASTRPGDVVATVPAWYSPLLEWRVGVRGDGGMHRTRVDGLPGARAFVRGGSAPTGRIWVLWFAGEHRSFPGFVRCAPDWTDGVTALSCLAPA